MSYTYIEHVNEHVNENVQLTRTVDTYNRHDWRGLIILRNEFRDSSMLSGIIVRKLISFFV